jgi:hypothetical protein
MSTNTKKIAMKISAQRAETVRVLSNNPLDRERIHRLLDASVAAGDWYTSSLCSRALITTPEEDPAAHAGCAAAIARNLDQG